MVPVSVALMEPTTKVVRWSAAAFVLIAYFLGRTLQRRWLATVVAIAIFSGIGFIIEPSIISSQGWRFTVASVRVIFGIVLLDIFFWAISKTPLPEPDD